ncbi:MAG: CPBP family intramembrane metalloprotease [Ilumatobacter sp.]|uniref:CPBP family intramembrane glutamic endopeptidase n=1 Tax=Ilumatobacter sp. TaxID=1967498 RepID=UPI002601918A|nr:CPBP family intramembrane glutamic endopeptidase [Ilumatobacter sp.]MDJ0769478.1 CPBP family intramembrane metalloprotease [Ilumatobacter sp.]
MAAPSTSEAREDGTSRRAIGWALVAVIALPTVAASSALGKDPSSGYGQTASLLLLGASLAVAPRSPALSALRSFIIVWIAYLVADITLHRILNAAGFFEWTDRTPKYQWITIASTLILIPSLVMLVAARALAFSGSELNVAVGDLRAEGAIPWSHRRVSWMWIGLLSVAVVVVGAVIVIALTTSPTQAGLERSLAWLPVGVVFGAVNALQEELRFRLVPLATLVPAVGAESALWMTAAIFGLAHWSGSNPSGPVGVVFAGFGGVWLAKSILDTNGVAWSWIIHAAGNIALFTFLTLDAS